MSTERIDTALANRAQVKYCEDNKAPHFAPTNYCYACRRSIYTTYNINGRESKGITVERAGNGLITGCPHCHRSYCD